jgi:hypothetical protein
MIAGWLFNVAIVGLDRTLTFPSVASALMIAFISPEVKVIWKPPVDENGCSSLRALPATAVQFTPNCDVLSRRTSITFASITTCR